MRILWLRYGPRRPRRRPTHHDARDLEQAAEAAGSSVDQVVRNIQESTTRQGARTSGGRSEWDSEGETKEPWPGKMEE